MILDNRRRKKEWIGNIEEDKVELPVNELDELYMKNIRRKRRDSGQYKKKKVCLWTTEIETGLALDYRRRKRRGTGP